MWSFLFLFFIAHILAGIKVVFMLLAALQFTAFPAFLWYHAPTNLPLGQQQQKNAQPGLAERESSIYLPVGLQLLHFSCSRWRDFRCPMAEVDGRKEVGEIKRR
ncbi:unnamed protein product [Protopolystoma xenopodis]|uniref:Uncharacterized protein n=1 Tax=Protopolystoma xenopodis TaxID=117903 RepID=A0A3S5BRM7_9PLAT|nr:unnamed protein product [Protopolystoma xenopodis]